MENTTVTYLGHSAWIVETIKSFFIFDYDKPPKKNSLVDLSKLQGKPTYFFSTHSHGDHYSKRLNQEVSRHANMKFITGDFKTVFDNSIAIQPRKSLTIDDIFILTAASTDLGVCYLINNKGFSVFHSGDLANWPDNEQTPVDYFKEIDFIASKANSVDIAFIPVSTFDWYQDPCLLEGAFYAINKLNPRVVFPMHANGRESLYKKFAKHAADKGITNTIVCMNNPGDTWKSPDTKITSL